MEGYIISFCNKGNLVLDIVHSVIDRGGGKHKDLRFYSCFDNIIHEPLIPGHMAFGRNVISEIVGFINDHKIVISPVHACQINISRHTAGSGKVSMVKHIIVKAILYQNIANIIPGINGPVIAEAFGCQNKDPIISKFIVFYHCKSSKGFPQPYAVRQNAAIVFFQLTDNTLGPILLKAVKFIPYD